MIEPRIRDRIGWPAGPWDDEPDRTDWVHEPTGLPCMTLRNRSGAWCGYVGVGPDHPWYGSGYSGNYDDETGEYTSGPDAIIDVHGGLTYASKCWGEPPEGICHVDPTGTDDRWWFGFDCCHWRDIAPGHVALDVKLGLPSYFDPESRYRTLAYVQAECARLAEQLAEVSA